MAVRNDEKAEQKQGLLAYGYNPGDRLTFLDSLGIPNRVGEQGEVQWQVLDYYLFWLNATDPYRSYLFAKDDRIYHSIFRGWNLFLRALDGNPIRLQYSWNIPELPTPDRADQVPTLWEAGSHQVQKMALISAHEYLKPQLEPL